MCIWVPVLTSSGHIPRKRISGSDVNSMFNSLRSCRTFPQLLNHFIFPSAMYGHFDFSTSFPILVIFHSSFYYSHHSGWKGVSCGFSLHWWASLQMLTGCPYILFGNVSIQIHFPLLNWGIFLLFGCKSFSTYSGYFSLSIYGSCKNFLPLCLFTWYFCVQHIRFHFDKLCFFLGLLRFWCHSQEHIA